MKRLVWLQHVPFEGLGYIADWASDQGFIEQAVRLYAGDPLPAPGDADLLVVMGGPMGVAEEARYPWLADEKVFIRAVIDHGTPVLGICLGAQLIAEVLGARVYPNAEKEIGWFPIHRSRDTEVDWLPEETTVFHWHGDTFDLPEGAERLCSSKGCLNQAFMYQERIIGLQFHLETTPASARALVENGEHEQVDGPYIQDAESLLAVNGYQSINGIMENLLTSMTR
jgi:GMP synthase-like glutamine amidotransferase